MELFDIISNDIKEAMKAKDKVALDTLRNIKKVLLEAKTAPGAGDTVSDETAIKLIQKLVKQGKESAELYNSQNRPELASEELAQVAIMEKYLPYHLNQILTQVNIITTLMRLLIEIMQYGQHMNQVLHLK